MKDKKFTYAIGFKEATFESDKPVIHNVVLLGAESKNKRRYTEQCMRSAVGLFENCQAFVNHPTKDEERDGMRDVRNLAGKFTNVRYENEKIRADFQGLPDDRATKKFMSIAENMPEIAGLSQNASGKIRVEDGIQIVESITKVHSVDLVASPATTNGMYENENKDNGENTMEYKDVTMIGLKEGRKDLVDKLIDEGKTGRDAEVKKLTEEKTALEAKLDELQVADALRDKEAKVDKILAESKLPTEAKTDVFRKMLLAVEVKDGKSLAEAVQELIDDRLTAISGKKGVTNNTEKGKVDEGQTQDAATVARDLKGETSL